MARKNVTTKSFEDMTKPELIKLCKQFGINASPRAKKEEIIKMIKAGQDSAAAKEEPGPTGKMVGRKEQLALREKDLEKAGNLFDQPLERFMHSLDSLTPSTRKRPRASAERKAPDEEEIMLMQSYDDPTFTLTGIIEGHGQTEHIRHGDQDISFVWITVNIGSKDIQIPSYHYFDSYSEPTGTGSKEVFSKIQRRVGATVDFNLTELSVDEITGKTNYYGTRLLAAKVKRCTTWYEKYDDGAFCIENGDIIDARVVEVWPRKIVVEIGGAETLIPIKDITKRHISNIETQTDPKLKPGSVVKVMVSNIVRQNLPSSIKGFDYPVSFSASMKDAEPDPQVLYFHDFKFGNVRRAIVTNIVLEDNPGGDTVQYYCQVLGGKPVVVKCILKCETIPKIDQEVRIRFTKFDEPRHFMYGEIFKVLDEDKANDTAFTVKL